MNEGSFPRRDCAKARRHGVGWRAIAKRKWGRPRGGGIKGLGWGGRQDSEPGVSPSQVTLRAAGSP